MYAESAADRVSKERDAQAAAQVAVEARLRELAMMDVRREEMLMKGWARHGPALHRMAPGRYRDGQGRRRIQLHPQPPEAATRSDGVKGRHLLRTNLTENDPALLWCAHQCPVDR